MRRRFALITIIALLLGSLALPATAQQDEVTPGAFCSPAGATGTTDTGTQMECTTTDEDPDQARWREAGSAPPAESEDNGEDDEVPAPSRIDTGGGGTASSP